MKLLSHLELLRLVIFSKVCNKFSYIQDICSLLEFYSFLTLATKVGRKSICVLPIGIEGLRLYGLIGGCLRTRDIMINTFSSGLSISTKTPSTATESKYYTTLKRSIFN